MSQSEIAPSEIKLDSGEEQEEVDYEMEIEEENNGNAAQNNEQDSLMPLLPIVEGHLLGVLI